jgi:hypothetical protein
MKRSTARAAIAAASLVAAAVTAAPTAAMADGGHHHRHTLYASPSGTGSACTRHAPCALPTAVANAPDGSTVVAKPGTYHVSGVTVTHRLRLVGDHAVIDATVATPTKANARGIVLAGAGAAGSSVSGFTVTNAYEEGILAMSTSHVTISHNVVTNNDRGIAPQAFDECAPSGPIPGDCGEGLHLMSVTGAHVSGNKVTGNAGGILLTDELGPTAHNVISHNVASRNLLDCGITIAGHNPGAVSPTTGKRQPSVGGIYDNLVVGNVADGNGTKGEGAGILMAGGAPFAGVYGNRIIANSASGNDLAGVVIHQHFAGDLNDNVVVGNRLRHNNVGGDEDFTPADTKTTDVLVASGPAPGVDYVAAHLPLPGPISGTVVVGNRLSNAHFGVWTLNAPTKVKGNRFHHVDVKVRQL